MLYLMKYFTIDLKTMKTVTNDISVLIFE